MTFAKLEADIKLFEKELFVNIRKLDGHKIETQRKYNKCLKMNGNIDILMIRRFFDNNSCTTSLTKKPSVHIIVLLNVFTCFYCFFFIVCYTVINKIKKSLMYSFMFPIRTCQIN